MTYDTDPFAAPPVAEPTPVSASPGIHLELLARIKSIIEQIRLLAAPADSEVADVLGEVRHLEVILGDWRRGLKAETPAKVEGKAYKVTESREATRSYNTAAILLAAARGRTLDVTIRELVAEKAVKLEWLWMPRTGGGLKRYFADHQLELRIVGREVPDDGSIDGPHVGEVWETTTEVEGKKEG